MPSRSFADKLKLALEGKGITAYALAGLADVTQSEISKLLLGKRQPSWKTVQKLAAALGVSCEVFADVDLEIAKEEPPAKTEPKKKPKKKL